MPKITRVGGLSDITVREVLPTLADELRRRGKLGPYTAEVEGEVVESDTAGAGPAVTVDPVTGEETVTAPGEPLPVIEQTEGTPLEPAEEEGPWPGSSSSTSPAKPRKSAGPARPSRPKRVPGTGSRSRQGRAGSSSASSTATSGPETGG